MKPLAQLNKRRQECVGIVHLQTKVFDMAIMITDECINCGYVSRVSQQRHL